MPLTTGDHFAGFTVERLLGSGGMGSVYLARHPRLPRWEALKILSAEFSMETEYRARFDREASLAAKLYHPHIVGVHDRGEFRSQLWISMDYVDGTDTGALLRDRYAHGMPVAQVLGIISAVADALDYAHYHGMLHRDVKPANILVTNSVHTSAQRVLLTDFGIARPMDEISDITKTDGLVGTLSYAAPEQLLGQSLDGRTDQYALAATAYCLLTGNTPFTGSTPAMVINQHLNSQPPHLGIIRPDLGALSPAIARGMAKKPAERFSTTAEFARALRAAAYLEPQHWPPQTTTTTVPPPIGSVSPPHITDPKFIATSTKDLPQLPARTINVAIGVILTLILVGMAAFAVSKFKWGNIQSPPIAASASPPSTSYRQPSTDTMQSPNPPTTTPEACELDNDADEVRAAMSTLMRTHPTFSTDGVELVGGNFNRCKTLTAVLVYPYGSSASTPIHALMFHKGQYIETATPDPYAFMSLNSTESTDTTVVLDFRYSPASCAACDDGGVMPVRFRWSIDHIDMVGRPPDLYRG